MNRIRTLDGWRGIAILMVIVSHAQNALRGTPFGGHMWLVANGRHGVAIFFVLSGYLITSRLLAEKSIDLKRFYVRRFFRLMPVAWIYLLAAAGVCLLYHTNPIGIDFESALLFFRNYAPWNQKFAPTVFTFHFWSLSIEEQFYLTWPAILMLLGARRSFWVALAGFCVSAGVVFRYWQFYAYEVGNGQRTEANIHALACGCALAIALQRSDVRAWVARHSRLMLAIAIPMLLLHVAFSSLLLITPSESLCAASALAATSVRPVALLEWKPLVFIGRISYSLYVWQQLFLIPHVGWIGVVMLYPVAVASYVFLEQPCIRLGARMLRPRVPSEAASQATAVAA
jgi:peptidoglycan/LPS O-acetylase OafA/YrhL